MGFDNTTENATDWQISIIESLIPLSYIPQQEKDEVERMIFDTELKYEEAELLSPAVKMNRIIKSLLDLNREDATLEAELMSAEMGVNLEQMLRGEVGQEVKPEREKEPTQVVPMFGGGEGAKRPQPPPTEQKELG